MTHHLGTSIQISITAAILTFAVTSGKAEAGDDIRQVLIESRIITAHDDFARDLGIRFGQTGFGPYSTGVNNFELDALGAAEHGSFQAGQNIHAMQKRDRYSNQGNGHQSNYGRSPYESTYGSPQSHQLNQLLDALEQKEQRDHQSQAVDPQFQEAVLKLDVTPHITPDDQVILDLNIAHENGHQPLHSPSGVIDLPELDTRSVATTVQVPDQGTVVVGGLHDPDCNDHPQNIPQLGNTPYLGNAFRNESQQNDKTQLQFFVTPTIVNEVQ